LGLLSANILRYSTIKITQLFSTPDFRENDIFDRN